MWKMLKKAEGDGKMFFLKNRPKGKTIFILLCFLTILLFTSCTSSKNSTAGRKAGGNQDSSVAGSNATVKTETGAADATTAADTTAVSQAAYEVRGNWLFTVKYSNGEERQNIYLLEGEADSGTVSNGLNYDGKYTAGNEVVFMPNVGDFKFIGKFKDENNMEGRLVGASTGNEKGSWTAVRYGKIKYDIRGEWILTGDWNGNPFAGSVMFGSAPSNAPAAIMTIGYCKLDNAFYKYEVTCTEKDNKNEIEVSWLLESNNKKIEYKGAFVDQDHMKGAVYEFNNLVGQWEALRKKD